MTVSSSTNRVKYDGNGVTTAFPFMFKILDLDDLVVTLYDVDGNGTVLAINTDYTVPSSVVGSENGGTVTMLTAPAVGEQLLLRRETELIQPTDFQNQGRFFPETHERAFDRLLMQIQELSEQLGRILTIDAQNDAVQPIPGNSDDRIGRFITFDALGNPIISLTTDPAALSVTEAALLIAYYNRVFRDTYAASSAIANLFPDGAVFQTAADEAAPAPLTGKPTLRTVTGGVLGAASLAEPIRVDLRSTSNGNGADAVANVVRRFASMAELAAYPKIALTAAGAIPSEQTVEVVSFYDGWSATAYGSYGGGSFVWDAASTATSVPGIIINPTGNTGNGRWRRKETTDLRVTMFGADPTGLTISTAAIEAANAYVLARGGGSLYWPEGTYLTTISIAQPATVSWVGEGSRQTTIKWSGVSLANYVKGVVYAVAGTDIAPDFVFSTSIKGMCIDANGIAPVALAIRGHQENCVFDDLLLFNFLDAGLDVLTFAQVNHGITFRDLHIVPASVLLSPAVGFRAKKMQKCTIENLTVDIENGFSYARGVWLSDDSNYNVITATHIEDAAYGIYEEGGALNTYVGLEALHNLGTGITHFYTDNNRYIVKSIRTRTGYTNQLRDLNRTIPVTGTPTDAVSYVAGASYFQQIVDTEYYERTLSGVSLTRGALAHAGITGNGQTEFRINAAIAPSATVHVELNMGAGDVGFAGILSVFSTGSQRYSTDVHFSGYVDSAGAVATAAVTTQRGTNTTALVISAPVALASPASGRIRIPIQNTDVVFTQSLELKVAVSVAGRQATSIAIS